MLCAINLITDTRRLCIFNTAKSYFTKNNNYLNNIVSCTNDGVPSVVGCLFEGRRAKCIHFAVCTHNV